MPTSNVSVLRTGTGWTVDVTACNLLSDLAVLDFQPFVNGTPVLATTFTKTSQTILTYTGVSLALNTPVIIQRKTPNAIVKTVAFASRFSSSDWNNEFDRILRRAEEYTLNGVGPSSLVTVATPLDGAYPTGWNGDVIFPPTRNAVFDALQLFAPTNSPFFTGAPSTSTPFDSDNSTRLATTAYVKNNLAAYAVIASPTFTGVPSANTATFGTNTTQLATTAFVQQELTSLRAASTTWGGVLNIFTNAVTIGGTATLNGATNVNGIATFSSTTSGVTPAFADATTKFATTAYVENNLRIHVPRTTISIAAGAGVVSTVTFGTALVNRGSIYSGGNQITVPTTGIYRLTPLVRWTTSVSPTYLVLWLYVNGAPVHQLEVLACNITNGTLKASEVFKFTASDVLTIRTDIGSAYTLITSALSLEWVSNG